MADEHVANLTGIYDILAQVLNEQKVLKVEREEDKKKIEALQRKIDLQNTGKQRILLVRNKKYSKQQVFLKFAIDNIPI